MRDVKPYVSQNRIKSSNSINEIKQPRPPTSTIKQFFQSTMNIPPSRVEIAANNTTTKPTDIFPPEIRKHINWIASNHYKLIPETTYGKDNDTTDHGICSDIALVLGYNGSDPLRIAATERALKRLAHANPKPALTIFIEVVNRGETAQFTNMENKGWDKAFIIQAPENSQGIFQKEAMWTIGAKYAFSQPGITKCVFIDSDACFNDNAWADYCSKALDKAPMGQPFIAGYYCDQPDAKSFYTPYGLVSSIAYRLANPQLFINRVKTLPGLAFFCTKSFFYDNLGGQWPFGSMGSGDVLFWSFFKGYNAPNHIPCSYTYVPSTINGMYPDFKLAYAPLIAIHIYHGPMINRMYTTRDYIVRRVAICPGTECDVDANTGLAVWKNSLEGRIAADAVPLMREINADCIKRGTWCTPQRTRDIYQSVAKKHYGIIDADHPLNIVTVMTDNTSQTIDNVKSLHENLLKYCRVPFKFIVYASDTSVNVNADQILKFTIDRPVLPKEWLLLNIFDGQCSGKDINTLYIDASVRIRANFEPFRCPEDRFYMDRPVGYTLPNSNHWGNKLIYFTGDYRYILDGYKKAVEYIFGTPSVFISNAIYTTMGGESLRDAITHLDYCYSKTHLSDERKYLLGIVIPN